MDNPTEAETDVPLNANRNVIAETPPSASSSSTTDRVNTIAAPVVVAKFDWKRWAPWILGLLLLLLVIWLLSRRSGGASVSA